MVMATACAPIFWDPSNLGTQAASGTVVRLIWNTATDLAYDGSPSHGVAHYEVRVDGQLVDTVIAGRADCRLVGLASDTTYDVEISAVSKTGETGQSLPPGAGALRQTWTTPPGNDPGGSITCNPSADSDGDRLPDWVEDDTGTFVDATSTGTDPNDADTDDDGITDGDEVVGPVNGLNLPQLGADPLRASIFLEIDWVYDNLECGGHNHRPSLDATNRLVGAFAAAPTTNPDGSTGIDLIVDRGQGGLFTGGNKVTDAISPFGALIGGVDDAEYIGLKAANFAPLRAGYFHYTLMVHSYNWQIGSTSSGQAEFPGDDSIVSLQCSLTTDFVANTTMHELGHNLDLGHGGSVSLPNWKPNYNSVMNYRFQFFGVDADSSCDALADGIIDFSHGDRLMLDELAVDEGAGVCAGGPAIDWDLDATIDLAPYIRDLNRSGVFGPGDGVLQQLHDHDDWAALEFLDAGGAGSGARLRSVPRIISDQPVPPG